MNNRVAILLPSLVLAIGICGVGLVQSHSAHAQPHGPMGGGASAGPEAAPAVLAPDQETGSVVVRVVAGSLEKPLAGLQVTLGGTTRLAARTDASGLATFSGLDTDTEYIVTTVAAGASLRSEPFALPQSGGVSVLLTTKAIGPGRGGRPSSRMMSGRARPEGKDPGGQLTVRAIQGELEQSQFGGLVADIPVGATIHLVAMHADGRMTVESKKVAEESEGRVVFDKLARDHSIAYYAMTVFERAGGSDRLTTQVLRMPPQVGSRMMFAGAPKNSASPGLDDLEAVAGTGVDMPGPGTVSVRLFAEESQAALLAQVNGVELIQIGSADKTRSAPVQTVGPDRASVLGRSGPMGPLPGTGAGQVSFYTVRPSAEAPVPNVSIRLERADAPTPPGGNAPPSAPPIEMTTNAEGQALFPALEPGASYVAVATLYGKEVRTDAFTPLADKGLSFAFAFEWPDQTVQEAIFKDLPANAEAIYIAKVFVEGRSFLSLPFQLTKETGAAVGIYMYPEVLFSMHGGAELDDTRMWFQVQLSLANPGIAPLKLPAGGLLIPLPTAFRGASVAEEMTARVGVRSSEGFFWRGPIPPGQRDFVATFALPVEDGSLSFDMALPHGLRSGRIVLEDLPGMELRVPPGAEVTSKVQPNGRKFLEMPNIQIAPKQRLVFGIKGLPQHSIWQKRVRIAVGVTALALIAWGVFVIFFARRRPQEVDPVLHDLESSRETLMGQLVRLERENRHKKEADKAYQKKRDKLNGRLADIYRQIDDHKAATRAAN